MTLYVRQLVKHFGGVQAVKGVSFEVNPGECVALIGPPHLIVPGQHLHTRRARRCHP